MRIKCMRILPEIWQSTLWPLSSSTRNIALGNGSMTVPSISMTSSLPIGSARLLQLRRDGRQGGPHFRVLHRLAPGPPVPQPSRYSGVSHQMARVFSLGAGHRPLVAIDDQDEAVVQYPVYHIELAAVSARPG